MALLFLMMLLVLTLFFFSTNYNRIITDHEIENVEVGPNIQINELYMVRFYTN